MWAAGERGQERGGKKEGALWRRVSHKSSAAASLVLLGLMKGGVTATLNSGQAGPWEGGDGWLPGLQRLSRRSPPPAPSPSSLSPPLHNTDASSLPTTPITGISRFPQ